jgi:tRNA (cytidine/uridine-2'-O-)-methyltransferase
LVHVVLVHPEIPQNTGNIIRLCANTGATLHLVQPMGFPIDHAKMRRAGLDYHEFAELKVHRSWDDYLAVSMGVRRFALTTKAVRSPFDVAFQPQDHLLFGSETAGLPQHIHDQFEPEQRLRLPMRPNNRSLNLSNAVAVTVFEAWRQAGFDGAQSPVR